MIPSEATDQPDYDNILPQLSEPLEWRPHYETAILEPFTYITATPGKDMRSRLIEAFNLWLKVPQKELGIIAHVVSMLHNASLMMDDVEDDSQLRRGAPVTHKIYGIPQTINTANYVYFLAYQELFKLRNDQASHRTKDLDRVVTDELLNLHRGQGLDLLWRDTLTCPTESEYIEMVNNSTSDHVCLMDELMGECYVETGGLFRIAIKLMMAMSPVEPVVDYVPLVNLIGVYFQIRDDYMNLQSTTYASNKGFAEDLTEGKFSFPVVHAIRADTSNRQVLNVLQKRPGTPTLKKHIISYMDTHTKTFEYTREVLKKLDVQTRAEVERLGGNAGLSKFIDSMKID
ncbi:geranylgeranyl pyrophosphate synthetase [Ceratobasidium sp. 414]|nr:geranylgeranyl pyrophosphate synthetase [Ceratobasidium sp. 414]